MNNYFCVSKEISNEIVIERSRFIGYAAPAFSDEDAKAFIAKIKKSHPFATHNCYAYIAENGAIARFSDDGEPQGTAGMPILEVIKNKSLVNTAIVVTRYFGGVKLGAGGLVRAYSSSASEVISAAGIDEYILSAVYRSEIPYDCYNLFLKFIGEIKCKVISTFYEEAVVVEIATPSAYDFVAEITDYFAKTLPISRLNEKFINYNT